MVKRLSLMLSMALLSAGLSVFAQEGGTDEHRTKLHYAIGRSDIDTALMKNLSSARDLVGFLDRLKAAPEVSIRKIDISSSASMEGDVASNRKLIARRNASVYAWIKELTGAADSLITCHDLGVAWEELRGTVDTSAMKYREEVLYIIDNVPEETWRNGWLVDSRNKHLMELRGGRAYRYMEEAFFPYFRYTRIRIVYSGRLEMDPDGASFRTGMKDGENRDAGMLYVDAAPDTAQTRPAHDTLAPVAQAPDTVPMTEIRDTAQPVRRERGQRAGTPADERRPFLAVKTNALMLLGGVANAGAEVRVSDRLSIDFPVIYTPYTIKQNYRLRALAFQPELRYWFGGFSEGHFVGLTGNLAWFNVALSNNNRYQDTENRPLMGAGISYGYAWKLTPNFRLEFTVGAGYANIHYDVFYNVENGIKYNKGVENYWGLTKAGVNAVYVFNFKQRR